MIHSVIARAEASTSVDNGSIDAIANNLQDITALTDIVSGMLHDTRLSVEALIPLSASWGNFEQLSVLLRSLRRAASEAKRDVDALVN